MRFIIKKQNQTIFDSYSEVDAINTFNKFLKDFKNQKRYQGKDFDYILGKFKYYYGFYKNDSGKETNILDKYMRYMVF